MPLRVVDDDAAVATPGLSHFPSAAVGMHAVSFGREAAHKPLTRHHLPLEGQVCARLQMQPSELAANRLLRSPRRAIAAAEQPPTRLRPGEKSELDAASLPDLAQDPLDAMLERASANTAQMRNFVCRRITIAHAHQDKHAFDAPPEVVKPAPKQAAVKNRLGLSEVVTQHRFESTVKTAALDLEEHDADNDNKLDFGEFCALVRSREEGDCMPIARRLHLIAHDCMLVRSREEGEHSDG